MRREQAVPSVLCHVVSVGECGSPTSYMLSCRQYTDSEYQQSQSCLSRRDGRARPCVVAAVGGLPPSDSATTQQEPTGGINHFITTSGPVNINYENISIEVSVASAPSAGIDPNIVTSALVTAPPPAASSSDDSIRLVSDDWIDSRV